MSSRKSEASAVPPSVERFFDAYRNAFDRLDGDAVASLYHVPSGIVSGRSYVHWPDAASIRANMVALCEHYRSQGYRSAHYRVCRALELGPDAVVVDIEWTIERTNDQEAWQFRTAYNLVRSIEGWQVLHCTAYEEGSS